VAKVSGVPGSRVTGAGGLDNGGATAADGGLGELCDGKLTANIFNASWAFGFGMPFLLGNLIMGVCGRIA